MTCKLRPVPDTLEFEATVGDEVTIVVSDPDDILIQRARYPFPTDIPIANPPTRSISFTVVKGRKTLQVVCVGPAGRNARGELREDCGGGHFQLVREVDGSEPLQVIVITGKEKS